MTSGPSFFLLLGVAALALAGTGLFRRQRQDRSPPHKAVRPIRRVDPRAFDDDDEILD